MYNYLYCLGFLCQSFDIERMNKKLNHCFPIYKKHDEQTRELMRHTHSLCGN